MELSNILIYVCIFIIIIMIIFGIAWRIRNNSGPDTFIEEPLQYTRPLVWLAPESDPDNPDENCYLYQFNTISVKNTIIDGYLLLSGQQSLNPIILDDFKNKTPQPTTGCMDRDQLLVRKGKQICNTPTGTYVEGAINFCTRQNGEKAQPGESQIIYYNDAKNKNRTKNYCNNLPVCKGEISLITLNYDPSPDGIIKSKCITNFTNQVLLTDCVDPKDLQNQLFRVTRINYGEFLFEISGSNEGTLAGNNGIFTQIFDRNTGLCLDKQGTTGLFNVPRSVFRETNGVDCSKGGPIDLYGENIIFGTCTGYGYSGTSVGPPAIPGFNWLFIPSMSFCSNPYGCEQNQYASIEQQMAYIGDIDMTDFQDLYKGVTGASYNGLTGDNAWLMWLIDNNAKTLYTNNKNIFLGPIAVNNLIGDYCPSTLATANYFNIESYNLLRKLPSCINGQISDIIKCIGW